MRLRWRRLKRRHGLGRRLRRPRRFRLWLWFCLGRFRFRVRRQRRCRDAATVVVKSWAEAGAADVSAPVALPLPWVMVRARVWTTHVKLVIIAFSVAISDWRASLSARSVSEIQRPVKWRTWTALLQRRSSEWAAPVPVPNV